MLRCLLVFVCLPAAVKATYYVYFHHPPHQPPYAHYVYFFGLSQFLKFLLGLVVAGFKINAAGYLPCKHAPKSRAVTRDGTEHEQNNDGKYPPEVQRLLDDLGLHRDFVIGALPPPLVYTLEANVTRARPTQTGANWSPRPWRARKSSRRSTGPSSSRRSKSRFCGRRAPALLYAPPERGLREKRDGAPSDAREMRTIQLIETQSHRVDKCAFGTASL